MAIELIISGGQTGADQGGIYGASALSLPVAGYAPKGWVTETGPAPWLKDYGLKEADQPGYPYRTELNIVNSDGTLLFGNVASSGSQLTMQLCAHNRLKKPLFSVSHFEIELSASDLGRRKYYQDWIHRWIAQWGIKKLNIAGNRESVLPGIQLFVAEYIVELFG